MVLSRLFQKKIIKWSQNILLSARNHVVHVSVLLLYSLFIYDFIVCVYVCVCVRARARAWMCVCVCGVFKGALVVFST